MGGGGGWGGPGSNLDRSRDFTLDDQAGLGDPPLGRGGHQAAAKEEEVVKGSERPEAG